MKKRHFLFILTALLSIAFSSCKKDKNLSENVNVNDIVGTYDGTETTTGKDIPDIGPSSLSVTLTKNSETKVDLEWGYNSFTGKPLILDGINISKSGSIFSLSRSSDFKGKVEGNKLTWTWGDDIHLITFSGTKSLGQVPTLTTTEVTNITATSAITGGNIISNGAGTITARGICWNSYAGIFPTTTDNTITSGYGSGSFTTNLTGLTEHTPYRIRAFATNNAGTGYGDLIAFETPLASADNGIVFNPNVTYGTVIDIEGNVYKTVQIGTQTWMAENLKSTQYRNGDPIPNITDNTTLGVSTGTYCWYNDDAKAYKAYYGALYNWYAVTDNRNIAPAGWHVPSASDWYTLTTFLGGEGVAGGKLKETGLIHWYGPNEGATNETGFSALPGGYREFQYGFYYSATSILGSWWSSTEYSGGAGMWETHYFFSNLTRFNVDKSFGCSVRCVKD